MPGKRYFDVSEDSETKSPVLHTAEAQRKYVLVVEGGKISR